MYILSFFFFFPSDLLYVVIPAFFYDALEMGSCKFWMILADDT